MNWTIQSRNLEIYWPVSGQNYVYPDFNCVVYQCLEVWFGSELLLNYLLFGIWP